MNISEIYKENTLYKINPTFPPQAGGIFTIPARFNGVAVLYESRQEAALNNELAAFLGKVIEAGMKLDPAQVLTANLCDTEVSLQKLAEQAAAKIVVIFGRQWLDTLHNANIHKNEIVSLYGMKILVTDTLDVINTNDAAKKAFWVQLKKLF